MWENWGSIEELALEALCKGLNEEINPSDKAEVYVKLSEKYLRDADNLFITFLSNKAFQPC